MPGVSLRLIIGQKSASAQVMRSLCGSLAAELCVVDPAGTVLAGEVPSEVSGAVPRHPILAVPAPHQCLGFPAAPVDLETSTKRSHRPCDSAPIRLSLSTTIQTKSTCAFGDDRIRFISLGVPIYGIAL